MKRGDDDDQEQQPKPRFHLTWSLCCSLLERAHPAPTRKDDLLLFLIDVLDDVVVVVVIDSLCFFLCYVMLYEL